MSKAMGVRIDLRKPDMAGQDDGKTDPSDRMNNLIDKLDKYVLKFINLNGDNEITIK